ncbi:hypothetical protein KKD52_08825 [Myxococcota bacterium]|nr:hypothetical protein [Myxococcota bacterium]MBU1413865.1 hypothetical protein [Myxococcota bacterium]MBU1510450.1 hypothetical protein [Myxococcota bacterium]
MKKTGLFLVALVLAPTLASAQTPHPSFFELPSTNGLGSVHYSFHEGDHKVAAFFPHLYKQCDADTAFTPNLAYDMYFGIRTGEAVWLNTRTESRVEYEPGTNIIVTEQTAPTDTGDVLLRQYLFAPFGLDHPGFVYMLELEGEAPPCALFSLMNFRMGSGADRLEAETITRAGNGWIESGAGDYVLYLRPVEVPAGFHAGSAGPGSPWQVMLDGSNYQLGDDPVSGDDLALGFQFNLPAGVAAGATSSVAILVVAAPAEKAAAMIADVEAMLTGKTPDQLLDEARADWTAFQGRALLPAGLSTDEEHLVRQGLAVMRMAQVREPNIDGRTPHGQILAALPKARPAPGEGIWNVAWVRDASYAIVGLARHGYLPEARDALSFMLRARSGEYAHAVGFEYLISVCRYYGCGREETDYNAQGPNIEFDDFGLFLWAFSQTVLADPDDTWWHEHWPAVRDLVAEVLVGLTQESTFLISPDSSIWERHWNGNEKNFTYTSAMAVAGLCGAADLAGLMGESDTAGRYKETVSRLRRGMRDNLVDAGGVLAGSLQELNSGSGYLDLAAVEGINFGAFAIDDPVTTASLARWHQDFFDGTPDGPGGYYRNDDGDWYDQQEWCFVDLRMSVAYSITGQTERRDALLDWVLAQSRENRYLMGELFCRGTADCPQRGDYRGSVPMIGFGPGAYLIALETRANPEAPTCCAEPSTVAPGLPDPERTTGLPDPDPDPDPDGTTADDSGCSCRAGGGRTPAGIWLPLFPLALVLLRRRRR